MVETNDGNQQPPTVVSKLSALIGVYSIFFFLSGWTYFDSYYSVFGIYARWLDLSATEVLTKGFVVLFEPRGWPLWLIYIFVLLVPILHEIKPRVGIIWQLVVAVLMLGCLPLTFFVAKKAGLEAASINQSESTNLPYVRFTTKCGSFSGRLLFVKDHNIYIHDLTRHKETNSSDTCLDLSQAQHGHHFLYVYRSEDVQVLEILEHPTGG